MILCWKILWKRKTRNFKKLLFQKKFLLFYFNSQIGSSTFLVMFEFHNELHSITSFQPNDEREVREGRSKERKCLNQCSLRMFALNL